jgi:Carboxypeptidase regulatory-like domain/TonB dependent receptor
MMRTWLVGFALLLACAAGAAAQTTDGSIRGYVRDEQGGVLPGVSITATSPAAATPYTAVTDQEGYYRLLNLPPGEYTIASELQGFAKVVRTNILVRAGLNLGVDLVMKVGALEETITVQGETPLLETSKGGQSVNVSGEMQKSLPLTARQHWSEFLNLTPGAVSADSTTNPSASTYYVHGAGIVSFSTLIDGADMSSAVNPWQAYISMAGDTVSDVQIKTGGMDASTPLGFGAAVSTVTQSGTNRFKGSASFAYTPKAWISENQPGGSSQTMSVTQPEGALGGPIAKNRAWFYGSYRRRSGTLGISRAAADVSTLQALVPSFQPFDNEINANILFVKVTADVNAAHRVSSFYSYDATPYNQNTAFAAGHFNRVVLGGHGYAARLDSKWTDWLTSQLAFSWNNKAVTRDLLNPGAISQPVFRSAILSAGQLVGTGQFGTLGNDDSATQSPYTKWTITNDWTAYRVGWLGSHEVQFGTSLQPHMTRKDTIAYANAGFAEEDLVLRDPNNPAAGAIPFKRIIYDVPSGIGEQGHFADNAVYVQDAWRPTSRLTVNAGVRVDHVTRDDDLFGVRVQSSTEVGPRAGLNYLLTSDAHNTVRFSFARVHDSVTVNHQTANGAGNFSAGDRTVPTIGLTTLYDLNRDGTFETTFITPAASKSTPNRIIDPAYHQPYVDEWTGGYRRQMPGQASIDVGYIHRTFRDRTALVEQNGIYDGSVFRGYRNEALNDIFLLTSNIWNRPVYDALEFVATKNTRRFRALGSYTRTWSRLDGTWQPNDPASFIQPTTFSQSLGLASNDNRGASLNNGYNAGTGAPEWVQHVARISGSYTAPWDIDLAVSYTLQNGRWSGPILTRLTAPDPRFGPTTVTLSNGRVVSNPLATTIRFSGATRDDGQFVLPATHYLNLRLGRGFALSGGRRLTVSLDFLNVVNAAGFQGFLTGANQLFSANYGKGGQVQIPRTEQLNIAFRF